MSLTFQYAASLQDYRRATRLWQLNTTLKRKLECRYLLASPFLGAVLLVLAASLVFLPSANRPLSGPPLAGAIGGCIGGGLVALFQRPLYARKVKRCYEQQNLSREKIVTVTERGIQMLYADGSAESRMDWSLFSNWVESDDLFMVFMNRLRFMTFPKNSLSKALQDDLRAILGVQIPKS
jgi:hypothetical protein